ncbi:MAG: hypothetical protein ACYTEX_24570 [Planctomycetota bacterium]
MSIEEAPSVWCTFGKMLLFELRESLTEALVAGLELLPHAGPRNRVSRLLQEQQDIIAEVTGGFRFEVDYFEVRVVSACKAELYRGWAWCSSMFYQQHEVVVLSSKIEAGIDPGVQIGRASKGLSRVGGGAIFAGMVDEGDGEIVLSL